jgi:hypothetical protein
MQSYRVLFLPLRCRESYDALAVIEVRDLTKGILTKGGEVIERTEMPMTALEFGGQFLCPDDIATPSATTPERSEL